MNTHPSTCLTDLDEGGALGVQVVVLNDLLQLREVPAVPFAHTHGEGVEVFIKLIQKSDRLNDHIISTSWVELDLRSGVGVTQTELGLLEATLGEGLDELGDVNADSTNNFSNSFIRTTRYAQILLDSLG